jgi:hypothetical protein
MLRCIADAMIIVERTRTDCRLFTVYYKIISYSMALVIHVGSLPYNDLFEGVTQSWCRH